MAEVVTVETREELARHLGRVVLSVEPYPDAKSGPVFDARIGWRTYIVIGEQGPEGFTNGPLPVGDKP